MMPDLRVQIKPGCDEGDSVAHVVPMLTPAGRWRLVGLSEVRGSLRSRMVEWYSVPFTVLAKPPLPVVIVPVIIKGEPGPAGKAGPQGKTGAAGAAGSMGATGATGAQGAKGSFWGGGK